MNNRSKWTALAALTAALVVPSSLSAEVLTQVASDHLVFEAEVPAATIDSTYKVIDSSTSPAIPTGASGGAGLWAHGPTEGTNDSNTGDGSERPMLYSIRFATPGDYKLYARGFIGNSDGDISEYDEAGDPRPGGGNDSSWIPAILGTDDTYGDQESETWSRNDFIFSQSHFSWKGLTTYTVTASDDYLFAPGDREDGKVYDRWAFVRVDETEGSLYNQVEAALQSGDDPAALNDLANVPEPATVGLLALGSLAAFTRRRRA